MSGLCELWSYIATLLLGGGAVAMFNAWRAGLDQRAARRAEYLSRQLTNLYGPLAFLCGHNQELFKHIRTFIGRIHSEYLVEGPAATEAEVSQDILPRMKKPAPVS